MHPRTMIASLVEGRTLATLFVVLAGSMLMAAASWIEVPMWPVPFTAQTYAVVLIGAACGWRLAVATLVTYLFEGAVGLPVFSGGAAGFVHLAGPTGGYLLGFLAGAGIVGTLVDRGWRSLLGLTGAMALGHVVILAAGVAWLAVFVGWQTAIDTGLTPFLLGSIVKILAAVATMRAAEGVRALGR